MIFNLIKRANTVLLLSALSISAYGQNLITAIASNLSTPTQCTEEDNINIPFVSQGIQCWYLEARHPNCDIGQDNCEANFTNCQSQSQTPSFSTTPRSPVKIFDDGVTDIVAVWQQKWWLPVGMEVSVDNNLKQSEVHYIRIHQKIIDTNESPEVLVLYMDGNLRLIPQPSPGKSRVCYGSSVIVGPAQIAARPLA